MDVPADVVTVDDLPQGYVGPTLGLRSDVITKIQDVVPTADFTDPAWGRIEGPGFSIEVSMGDAEEEITHFVFGVRGSDLALGVIADILDRMDLRGLDPQSETGALFSPATAAESLRNWRAYRDQVVNPRR